MANQLNILRKENNTQDNELSKENSAVMTDIVCYLRSSNLCEYDLEIIRKELIGMALEAQLRGGLFGDVVGEDYKAFCRELMRNGRQKTTYEKALGSLYTFTFAFMVLYIAEIFFSSTFSNMLKLGQFAMPITLGFVIGTLIAMGMGYGIYYYFTKSSFEFSKKNRKIRILYVIGFAIVWTAALLFRFLLDKTVLLTINCLYPIIGLAAAFIMIKLLNDRYTNSFFKSFALNHVK